MVVLHRFLIFLLLACMLLIGIACSDEPAGMVFPPHSYAGAVTISAARGSDGNCVLNKTEVCVLKGITVTACRGGALFDHGTGTCVLPPPDDPPPGPSKPDPGNGGGSPVNGGSGGVNNELKGEIHVMAECTARVMRWEQIRCGLRTDPPHGVDLVAGWAFEGEDWQGNDITASGSGKSWSFEGETSGTVTVTGTAAFAGQESMPFTELSLEVEVVRCGDLRDGIAEEYKNAAAPSDTYWNDCTNYRRHTFVISQADHAGTENGEHGGYGHIHSATVTGYGSIVAAAANDGVTGIVRSATWRCPEGNANIPRAVPGSSHVTGRALDLKSDDWGEDKYDILVRAANDADADSFSGWGTGAYEYTDHIHIDWRHAT